jgi:hypothetical protein
LRLNLGGREEGRYIKSIERVGLGFTLSRLVGKRLDWYRCFKG